MMCLPDSVLFSLEGLMLKLQSFGHLIWRANSLEKMLNLGKIEGRRIRGWQWTRWLDGIADSKDMNLSKLREIVKAREAWHAAARGVANSRTWLSDWTTTNTLYREQLMDHCSVGKKLGEMLYFHFPHMLKYPNFSFCRGGYGDFLFVWKHVWAY